MTEFNPIDFDSVFWEKLKALFEQRLEMHRSKNDGRMDAEETARTRGKIAEAQYVLALPKTLTKVAPAPVPDKARRFGQAPTDY